MLTIYRKYFYEQFRTTKSKSPRQDCDNKIHISTGNNRGSIIHLIGREETPARFEIMEVRVW